jgi:S-formylglutathione hydrolase FrmB
MTPGGVHWPDQPGGQPGVARAAAGKTLGLRRRQASTGPGRVAAVSGVVVAALAVAGVAGAARYVQMFWLYRGFPAPVAPRSVVAGGQGAARRVPVILGAVQAITVTSAALGGWPDPVLVVLPPGYASHPRLRYPVLYLLHGVPGLPDQFLNVGQAATAEATLVAEGRMKPVILVMPAGSRSFLADQEWADGIRPGSGWETFIARDLVAAIDARYRTIAAAGGRGIAGLSEGGYGALNIGLHHPGEFGVLESWSGYMTADPIPAIFGRSPAVRAYNSPLTWAPRAAPRCGPAAPTSGFTAAPPIPCPGRTGRSPRNCPRSVSRTGSSRPPASTTGPCGAS